MEQVNQVMQDLISISPNTDKIEIPYILTPDEETRAIERKIDSLRDHLSWKLRDKGENLNTVETKLREADYNSMFDKDVYLAHINMLKWEEQEVEKRRQERIENDLGLRKADIDKYNEVYMYELLQSKSKEFGSELEVTDGNRKYRNAICLFLAEDDGFIDMGYNFKKGLLIRGKYGIGKTFIVKCLKDNKLNPIAIYNMVEINEAIRDNGEFHVSWNKRKILIDDVGTGDIEINYYGTRINWFRNFIEKFHNRPHTYNRIILTTNLNFDEMEEKYGGHIRSRLAEMFNVINVTGEDYRKK